MSQPTIRGVFKGGRVKLLEPAPVKGERPVLIVFLEKGDPESEWKDAARKNMLKGYARRDRAYDAL